MASHGCGQSSLLGSRGTFPSSLPIWWTSVFSAAFFFSPLGATFLCQTSYKDFPVCRTEEEAVGSFLSVLL